MSAGSQLRRLALQKCAEALASERNFKTAQQVGLRFGDKSLGPRRLDSFPQVQAAGGNVLDAIAAYRKNRPNPFVPRELQARELKVRLANANRPAPTQVDAGVGSLLPRDILQAVRQAVRPSAVSLLRRTAK